MAVPATSDKVKKNGDAIATYLDVLLSSARCEEFSEELRRIKAAVCPPVPVKHGAAVSSASQRVCIALKSRDAAVAKRKQVTDEMAKLLQWMEEINKTVPELDAAVKAAEDELLQARAENDKAMDSAVGPAAGPPSGSSPDAGPGSDSSSVILALQLQVRELQSRLVELTAAAGGSGGAGAAVALALPPVPVAVAQGGDARGRDSAPVSAGAPPRDLGRRRSRSRKRLSVDDPEGDGAMEDEPDGARTPVPTDLESQVARAQQLAEWAGVAPVKSSG
jgi:hypothetical protein